MVPIKVCNAPQIFTRDLTGLPPNLVRFVTLSEYLGWSDTMLNLTPRNRRNPRQKAGPVRKGLVRHRINDIVQSASLLASESVRSG